MSAPQSESGAMEPVARIWVPGHRGLVGRALVRRLRAGGHENLLVRTRDELDLRDTQAVDAFVANERPEYVFVAAARVGGILANSMHPVEFLAENLRLELNIIESAHRHRVRKLLFLGSSCIYPKLAPQPLREDSLLTGPLEPTNEAYAIAKIAGVKLCDAYASQHGATFSSAMPTNLYGPHDNFDLQSSHVLPALIRKFHEAADRGDDLVEIWGTGTPRREFLFVDDLADACVFLIDRHAGGGLFNVGTGSDVTIAELASTVAEVTGFGGGLRFDSTKPDGTPRKLMDVTKLQSMGWQSTTPLRAGIESTYAWFRENVVHATRGARASAR